MTEVSDLTVAVLDVLDTQVRPLLAVHGGGVELVEVTAAGEVRLEYQGACRGCSLGADQVSHLAHLNARDTTLAWVSRAPQAEIARLKVRMGWET